MKPVCTQALRYAYVDYVTCPRRRAQSPEPSMSPLVRILIVLVISLSMIPDAAQARHRKGHVHGIGQMPAATVVAPARSPRLNTSVVNQPGVPNTSRPGTIGTGAVPSGLSGDNPIAPGFPGRVGRD
jgi:hypothetical protein